MSVTLPASEAAWAEIFNDDDAAPLGDALNSVYGIGYALASQGLLGGR